MYGAKKPNLLELNGVQFLAKEDTEKARKPQKNEEMNSEAHLALGICIALAIPVGKTRLPRNEHQELVAEFGIYPDTVENIAQQLAKGRKVSLKKKKDQEGLQR